MFLLKNFLDILDKYWLIFLAFSITYLWVSMSFQWVFGEFWWVFDEFSMSFNEFRRVLSSVRREDRALPVCRKNQLSYAASCLDNSHKFLQSVFRWKLISFSMKSRSVFLMKSWSVFFEESRSVFWSYS
jgi:hypothetical protein